ncbi:MAG: hydrogenase 3 maturation endopeptidase HyCI [Sedimentisphaerales bacterium]|nr:hydrogenase 3 maturation endopeptidase HyCI [Sedimentisphaerales bacterium]
MDQRLLESLAQWRDSRVVIVGIGSTLKGDDAAGPLVCERLSGRVSARVIDAGTVPENYIGVILKASPDVLFIVDAIDFGGRPGQIRVCMPDQIQALAFSTHALALHLSLDLVRRERTLDVRVIGIQAAQTKLGDCLSPAVREAVGTLVDTLTQLFGRDR